MKKKTKQTKVTEPKIGKKILVGKIRGRLTPGFELRQSWRALCFEILQKQPDLPQWEIYEELRKRGIKKLIPSIRDAIARVRTALNITTWRGDDQGDPYIIVPVRMSREKYEELAKGGQHVGIVIENYLHKIY